MKTLKEDFIKAYQNERGIIVFIIINFLLSIGLLVFSLINLNSNSSVVKIGYGDIGGYRDGTWFDMLAFPIIAVVFGVLHGLLALRIFHKRGGMATTSLIIETFLVIIRLLGEG